MYPRPTQKGSREILSVQETAGAITGQSTETTNQAQMAIF
jgi:hypothetical protein